MIDKLTQMMLDGTPIKSCSVTIRLDGGGTVQAKISGSQAKKVVQAIVDIVSDEKHEW